MLLGDILHNLKFDLGLILKWFKVDSLKQNPSKFQFMKLGINTEIKVIYLWMEIKMTNLKSCPTWNNY